MRDKDENDAALQELEAKIALDTKRLLSRLEAWRYLIHWCSSFGGDLFEGGDGIDLVLTNQQSAEFAFSYDPINHPEAIVILAQPELYECLTNIGIGGFKIDEDGVIFYIQPSEIFDFYVAGMVIKIKASLSLTDKLKAARKTCRNAQIAEVNSSYDSSRDRFNWSLNRITQTIYPVVSHRSQLSAIE